MLRKNIRRRDQPRPTLFVRLHRAPSMQRMPMRNAAKAFFSGPLVPFSSYTSYIIRLQS